MADSSSNFFGFDTNLPGVDYDPLNNFSGEDPAMDVRNMMTFGENDIITSALDSALAMGENDFDFNLESDLNVLMEEGEDELTGQSVFFDTSAAWSKPMLLTPDEIERAAKTGAQNSKNIASIWSAAPDVSDEYVPPQRKTTNFISPFPITAPTADAPVIGAVGTFSPDRTAPPSATVSSSSATLPAASGAAGLSDLMKRLQTADSTGSKMMTAADLEAQLIAQAISAPQPAAQPAVQEKPKEPQQTQPPQQQQEAQDQQQQQQQQEDGAEQQEEQQPTGPAPNIKEYFASMQELERSKRYVSEILINIRGRLQMMHKDFHQLRQTPDVPDVQGRLQAIAREIAAANQAILHHSAQVQRISQQQLQTSHDWLQKSRSFTADQEALFLRSYAGQLRSSGGAIASHLGSTAVQMRLLQQQLQALMAQDRARPGIAAEIETVHRQQQFMNGQTQSLLRQQEAINAEMERVQQRFRARRSQLQQTGPRKYNNLMTYSEKQWLVKIQLKQLQTDNPYLDDFYFQTFTQRKAREIQMRAAAEGRPVPQLLVPNTVPTVASAVDSHHQQQNTDYRPEVPFDQHKTLGHITSFNVRTPRQLIDMSHAPAAPIEADGSEASAAKLETRLRRQTLILIEELYKAALKTESLDKAAAAAPSPQARRAIFEERKAALDAVFVMLHATDSSANSFLARVSAVRKGMVILGRILLYFSLQQALTLINSMLTLLSKRSGEAADAFQVFVVGVQRVFEYFPVRALIDQLDVFHKLCATPEGKALFVGKYGSGLMFSLQRRADQMLMHASGEERGMWVALSQTMAKELSSTLEEHLKQKQGQTLPWQLSSMFVAHGGEPIKRLFRDVLGPVARAQAGKEPNNPAIAQFLHLLN